MPEFIRSAVRTIQVSATSRTFIVGTPGYWDATNAKKPKGLKDPDGTLDITLDWKPWLDDIGGVPIASIEWFPSNGVAVVSNPPAIEGRYATVVLTGGEPGDAPIGCRITTDSVPPLTEDRTVILVIEER